MVRPSASSSSLIQSRPIDQLINLKDKNAREPNIEFPRIAFPTIIFSLRIKLLRLHCEGATAIAVSLCWTILLAGSNSAGGASVSASAAVQAGVGIDRVDVAFLDCIGGAY